MPDNPLAERRPEPESAAEVAHVQVFRITQTERTKRILIVCLTGLGGLWILKEGYVEVAALPRNIWLDVLTLLVGAGWPAPFVFGWVRKIRDYMMRDHQRTIALESAADPGRLTSGLAPDGTKADA